MSAPATIWVRPSIILVGLATHSCTLCTAHDANMRDFKVTVVSNCCAARTARERAASRSGQCRHKPIGSPASRNCCSFAILDQIIIYRCTWKKRRRHRSFHEGENKRRFGLQ